MSPANGQPGVVITGSGGGGIDIGEKQYEDFFTAGGRHVTPYAIGICGIVSSEISISLGLRGIRVENSALRHPPCVRADASASST